MVALSAPTTPATIPDFDLRCGDAITLLRQMPDQSVQCCVCSPPYYGLRSYGTPPVIWDGDPTCQHRWYTRRPRKPNQKPQTNINGRGSKVATVAPSRLPAGQSCVLCSAWCGELGNEPTPEMFIRHIVQVFREVRRVLKDNGTLFVNIADSYAQDSKWGGKSGHLNRLADTGKGGYQRTRRTTGIPDKSLIGIPWAVAFAMRDDGWIIRNDIIWAKDNGMPASVLDRFTVNHEYVFLFTKQGKYQWNREAILEPQKKETQERIARGFKDRYAEVAAGGHRGQYGGKQGQRYNPKGRNPRTVRNVSTEPFPGSHYAVFPLALILTFVLAGTFPGDIVLDLFGGRGTVTVAAIAQHRRAIYIDAQHRNLDIARIYIRRGGVWFQSARKPPPDAVTLWQWKEA